MIQMSAIPAVARMEARGFRLDAAAHARLLVDLAADRQEAEAAYLDACRERARRPGRPRHAVDAGREGSAADGPPVASDELANWARTAKAGRCSTKRAELRRAAHYPPIAHLLHRSPFSTSSSTVSASRWPRMSLRSPAVSMPATAPPEPTAAARPARGRTCSRYRGTSGSAPLFVADPGHVLVAADFSSMELRAAAEISGDDAMRAAFRRGDDLHSLTAATVTGKKPEDVMPEERSSAKRVNFGAAYGMGPDGLVKSAWDAYGLALSRAEAEQWLAGFAKTYPTFAKWRRKPCRQVRDGEEIVIGRDAAEGIGRVFELAWLPPGRSAYTVACNLPIQGACADASMLALAAIDDALFVEGIDGGPVAWLHDEIVLEVPIENAKRAAELLEKAMIDAFAETFPNAPLNGLVDVHSGTNWASLKT